LRGVKESVVPLIPIFLIFIFTHAFVILYAMITHFLNFPTLLQDTVTDVNNSYSQIGLGGMILLLMRSYSMGAGTYTGIEAVSNGLPILREPRVKTGKRTMNYMMISLAVTVVGLMFAYLLYNVVPKTGKTLNAVLFENVTQSWNSNIGHIFILVTLISEAALLFIAAQTGFLDGPRVLANMALDRWFPGRFSMLSDRFVTQNGIFIMGFSAFVLMYISHGSVQFLVVLYSINVFITFVLSQLGMVRHWWLVRSSEKQWRKKLCINGIGLVLTSFILLSMIILKFFEGGWITIFVTGALTGLVIIIKRHYNYTQSMLKKLNNLVPLAIEDPGIKPTQGINSAGKTDVEFDLKADTAVLLVSGFSGLGLHTLYSVIRTFKRTFKNFLFIQIGVIDAGNFKGQAEMENLHTHSQNEVDRYTDLMKKFGYYAESLYSIGVDVVEETDKIINDALKKYPNMVVFGGQLVFPRETFFTRLLHNHTIFAIQRKLYHQGIPVVIMPILVK
jgi:hypothetical protein